MCGWVVSVNIDDWFKPINWDYKNLSLMGQVGLEGLLVRLLW